MIRLRFGKIIAALKIRLMETAPQELALQELKLQEKASQGQASREKAPQEQAPYEQAPQEKITRYRKEGADELGHDYDRKAIRKWRTQDRRISFEQAGTILL